MVIGRDTIHDQKETISNLRFGSDERHTVHAALVSVFSDAGLWLGSVQQCIARRPRIDYGDPNAVLVHVASIFYLIPDQAANDVLIFYPH